MRTVHPRQRAGHAGAGQRLPSQGKLFPKMAAVANGICKNYYDSMNNRKLTKELQCCIDYGLRQEFSSAGPLTGLVTKGSDVSVPMMSSINSPTSLGRSGSQNRCVKVTRLVGNPS